MSHFVECQTKFRDPQALVAALVECGFEASQIEIHEQAVALYGYEGDGVLLTRDGLCLLISPD